MRRVFDVMNRVFLLLALFTLVFQKNIVAEQSGPVFKWKEKTCDFGQITEFAPKQKVISFENHSKDTVRVDSVRSSSDKISVSLSDTILKPGENGELKIEAFGFDQFGIFGVPVMVYTNKGTDTLSLLMNVNPSITLSPSVLDIKKIYFGDTTTMTSTISWKRKEKPSFTVIKSGKYIVKSAIEPLGSDYILEAKIAAQTHDHTFNDTITISTGCSAWPQLVVPVTGEVFSTFIASPASIDFGEVSSKTQASTSITLLTDRVGKFKLSKIESKPYFLSVSNIVESSKKGRLFVKIIPGERPRPFKGIIRIFINNNAEPDIEIPVKGKIIE